VVATAALAMVLVSGTRGALLADGGALLVLAALWVRAHGLRLSPRVVLGVAGALIVAALGALASPPGQRLLSARVSDRVLLYETTLRAFAGHAGRPRLRGAPRGLHHVLARRAHERRVRERELDPLGGDRRGCGADRDACRGRPAGGATVTGRRRGARPRRRAARRADRPQRVPGERRDLVRDFRVPGGPCRRGRRALVGGGRAGRGPCRLLELSRARSGAEAADRGRDGGLRRSDGARALP